MFEQRAITSIVTMMLIIFLGYFLRNIRILKEDNSKLFADLILKVTLPALIFSALSQSSFTAENIMLAVVMILSMLVSAALAFGIGTLMKLSPSRKGGLVLASTFPSSAFLGYAIIKQIYADNPDALADAVIVSELGVAIPLFTLGVFIAMHFGNTQKSGKEIGKEISVFLYSPIFVSIVLGLLLSFIPLPGNNLIIGGIYQILQLVSTANSFLVALCIGVMLRFIDMKKYIGILLVVILIKLLIQPLLSYGQSFLFNLPETWRQVLVLEAGMPTAAMTAVFAKKYGDDAELTSVLVFATLISSAFTMIMILVLLG